MHMILHGTSPHAHCADTWLKVLSLCRGESLGKAKWTLSSRTGVQFYHGKQKERQTNGLEVVGTCAQL